LAIIIEVAAMNQRQKEMGYNAAQELLTRLGIAEDMPELRHGDEWTTFD
ncbi:MAG: HPr kinase/phosphorylase, partial [Oscillospiraceae bacterium]|nr:HPr kinase/phosphorylase [Oscillospiraceae bacterium]